MRTASQANKTDIISDSMAMPNDLTFTVGQITWTTSSDDFIAMTPEEVAGNGDSGRWGSSPAVSCGVTAKGGCRRNMVVSLPRGMPKVVDYRQTDAQATNKMVTQDRHEVLSRFGRQEGVIPTSCV